MILRISDVTEDKSDVTEDVFDVTYTPPLPGTYVMNIRLDGHHVAESPYHVTVGRRHEERVHVE